MLPSDFCANVTSSLPKRGNHFIDWFLNSKFCKSAAIYYDGSGNACQAWHIFFSINIFSSAWFHLRWERSRIDTPFQQKHSCCHHSSQKTFKTISDNISVTKNSQLKGSLKEKQRGASGRRNWGWHGLWVCGSTKFCSFGSPKQNVSNWSAQQSIHQCVHWDEEINAGAFLHLFNLCQRALIQAPNAIKWTYPKGKLRTRYWYLKGCLGGKKRPL